MVLTHGRTPKIAAAAGARRVAAVFAAAALLGLARGAAAAARAADAPPPRAAEVSLPLGDWVALEDGAERADEVRQTAARREPAAAGVTAQQATVDVEAAVDGSAATGNRAAFAVRYASQIEVAVQGRVQEPVALPSAGLVSAVEVLPAGSGAAAAGSGPQGAGLFLVAPEPGHYSVRVRSDQRVADELGVSRVALPPILAPVAAVDVVLPAGLAWECAGMVVIDERVQDGRRRLRLSAPRGTVPVLVLRAAVAGDQSAELLVQDVAATLIELRPDGLRRQDMILYEVQRGGLADFVVDLPPGLEVDHAATDEGPVAAIAQGRRLTVHRRHRLTGSGYLVLTSRPPGGPGVLPLAAVAPQPAPRARYLATATAAPGRLEPRPAAAWTRLDLDDLPAPLRGALAALDSASAWRLAADGGDSAVEWRAVPQAGSLETVVLRRLTTTLLTADGTLLHRDTFELAQAGTVLSLTLPTGATLWSAAIDGAAVRPLERGSRLDVPLAGGARVVEVVEVLPRAVAAGRSRLTFDLAQVDVPVVEHRWRLLLPERARYRFAGGSLSPVPAAMPAPPQVRWVDTAPTSRDPWAVLLASPGVLTDRVNEGGNESGQQATWVRPSPAGTAGLLGRVVDPAGAPLPGVTVILAADGVQGRRLAQLTGSDGRFAFSGVPPGVYRMKAELDGFAPFEYPRLQMVADATHTAELTMTEVVEELVTATSESPLLDEPRRNAGIAVTDLRNGLAGGVRPLPISVPESGKALLLAGVLPPPQVTVELEVKSDRRRGE